MADGRALRIGCAIAASAAIVAVFASIGVLAFTARSVFKHLDAIVTSPSPTDNQIVQPALLHLTVTQPAVAPYAGPPRRTGFDVSYPQCGKTLPSTRQGFAIIGIAGGAPLTRNKCRDAQWSWASKQSAAAVYVNTSDPATKDPEVWGKEIGASALFGITATGVPKGTPVWLDVETENTWNGSWERHVTVLQTMAQTIADAGYPVGIYSNVNLWYRITGNATVNVPTWYATGPGSRSKALGFCGTEGFGGKNPSIVQWVQQSEAGYLLDHNAICPGVSGTGILTRTGN